VSLARVCAAPEAVASLRQAAALAAAGGADGVHRDAVAALAALGQPAPARPPATETLSVTERQILDRHLAGVDERDIAEALLLTPRSVRAALDAMRAAGTFDPAA
jgi:DNA-binding NarL/FixJ family response regulator